MPNFVVKYSENLLGDTDGRILLAIFIQTIYLSTLLMVKALGFVTTISSEISGKF